MPLVFHRRLAIPLWAIAFFTVALTAPSHATPFLMPPTALFVIAALGIAAITVAAATWVRTLDEPNRSEADDALSLVRMDDDGGANQGSPV